MDTVGQGCSPSLTQQAPNQRPSSRLKGWLLGIARHNVEAYYRMRLREPGVGSEFGIKMRLLS